MRLRRRAAHIAHCSVVTGAATEQASHLEEGKRFPYCLLGRVPHERRSCLREAQLHDLPAVLQKEGNGEGRAAFNATGRLQLAGLAAPCALICRGT